MICPKFSWWLPHIPVIHHTDLFLHVAVNINWFSDWTLYYFNLIKLDMGKWNYSERDDCNSKLGNLEAAGNYWSPFLCAHLPPLGTWLVPREVHKVEWSLWMGLFSHLWLMITKIGHKKQKIPSRVDLMKEGKELHFISQQIHDGCMLPTATERRHSWRQLPS